MFHYFKKRTVELNQERLQFKFVAHLGTTLSVVLCWAPKNAEIYKEIEGIAIALAIHNWLHSHLFSPLFYVGRHFNECLENVDH